MRVFACHLQETVCVVVVLSSDGVVSSRMLSQQRAIGRSRNRYRQQQCHHQLHSTTRVLASALPLQFYTTYSVDTVDTSVDTVDSRSTEHPAQPI